LGLFLLVWGWDWAKSYGKKQFFESAYAKTRRPKPFGVARKILDSLQTTYIVIVGAYIYL